jgi:hypothetical protein
MILTVCTETDHKGDSSSKQERNSLTCTDMEALQQETK